MEVLEGAPVVERPVVVEEEEKGPVPIAHQESVSSLGTMATDSTDPPDAAPVVVKATLSPAWCASLDILAAIQQKYFHIETNEFRGRTNGRTGQDEAMICDCSFDPRRSLVYLESVCRSRTQKY